MKLIKQFLIVLVDLFFRVYFFIFGKPKISSDLGRAVDLYKDAGFSSLFKLIRVWDAPYIEIEKRVPTKGKIIDLGSGDGLMANYLALSKPRRHILGIELNKKRLIESDKRIKNAKFKSGNILKSKIYKADAILLIHVLHHLSGRKAQLKMLDACKRNLQKGGKLIIAEIIQRPYWKYLFTYLVDILVVPILFEGKLMNTNIFYRKDSEWKKILKDKGFILKTTYPHKTKPFSHVLYEAVLKK